MANYLVTRENLSGIVLLCDPRLGLTELDEILLDVIRPRVEQGLKFLLVLTKADKLTRVEATKALSIAKLQAGGGQAMLFSATKRQGFDDVASLLWQWAHPADGAAAAADACSRYGRRQRSADRTARRRACSRDARTRRGQYTDGSPGGRTLKRLCTQ